MMTKHMPLFILSWMALSAVVQAEEFRVMTWNIRYNNPGDGPNAWPQRKDWVADIVKENQIEIAGFQEVLVGQLHDLKQRLPQMEVYGVGRDDGREAGEFSPIFYRRDRFELLDKGTYWLSPTPDVVASKGWDAALPRIASWIKLKSEDSGTVFYVMNTHFDHRGEQARVESAKLLLQQIRERFTEVPVLLTGDFNATPASDVYATMTSKRDPNQAIVRDTFTSAREKPEGPNSTWNGFQQIVPDQRIDFVFVTKAFDVRQLKILTDQRDGRFPSDHLPIVTTIEIQKK